MSRTLAGRIAVLLVLAIPLPAVAVTFSSINVLGDSLSDQGNMFLATSALIGPANAIPSADHYFAGRFSNGPAYTDVLAERLGLPLGPSLAGGNNFAFGGARTDYNTVETVAGGPFPPGLFPWSLNRQIEAFAARGVHDQEALYVVFSGSNDIADILTRGLDANTVIADVLDAVLRAVAAFELAGARTILVPNVPDLGLTPGFVASPAASAAATALSAQYNALLHQSLALVSGPRIVEFDTFAFLREIVEHPDRFGFSNVITPCFSGFIVASPGATVCDAPDEHAYWDIVHPTRAVHRLLGEAMIAALPATAAEPSGFALLLLGSLILLTVRCRSRR
jgi:outer membrane lipase/esterase